VQDVPIIAAPCCYQPPGGPAKERNGSGT
jgi:hypothetical protein